MTFRCTMSEREWMEVQARGCNLSLGDWIRKQIFPLNPSGVAWPPRKD